MAILLGIVFILGGFYLVFWAIGPGSKKRLDAREERQNAFLRNIKQ
jgi:hypothetical protein